MSDAHADSAGPAESEGPADDVRLGWWLSSEEHDPRALVLQAVAAEKAGFSTSMISDHLQPWVRHQAQASFVWSVLGAIAHATDALQMGTGVTAMVSRNDPINIAQAAATISVMSQDRFFLGVGTGERLNEQCFGRRWARTGERRDQMEEAINVLRKIWSGKNVNHRGDTWRVENLQLLTRPASTPPLYIAASGRRSAALAGRIGNGIIGVAPDRRLVDVFRGSGGSGKPCLGQLHVSLAGSLDAAIENAWEWWPHGVLPPTLLSELARPAQFESAAEAIGRDSITETVVCATEAAPVIVAIDRFVGAGFSTVYIHQIGPDQRRLIDMSETDLLPHYRRRP